MKHVRSPFPHSLFCIRAPGTDAALPRVGNIPIRQHAHAGVEAAGALVGHEEQGAHRQQVHRLLSRRTRRPRLLEEARCMKTGTLTLRVIPKSLPSRPQVAVFVVVVSFGATMSREEKREGDCGCNRFLASGE